MGHFTITAVLEGQIVYQRETPVAEGLNALVGEAVSALLAAAVGMDTKDGFVQVAQHFEDDPKAQIELMLFLDEIEDVHFESEALEKAKGKVRTMSGDKHKPRKLKKDSGISPEEASKRIKFRNEYFAADTQEWYIDDLESYETIHGERMDGTLLNPDTMERVEFEGAEITREFTIDPIWDDEFRIAPYEEDENELSDDEEEEPQWFKEVSAEGFDDDGIGPLHMAAEGDSCYVCKKEVSVGSPETGECDDCGAFFHYPDCDRGAGFSDDPMSWFCSPCAKDIVSNAESFETDWEDAQRIPAPYAREIPYNKDTHVKMWYEGDYEDEEGDNYENVKSYSILSKDDWISWYNSTKYDPCECDDVIGCLSCYLIYEAHEPELKGGFSNIGVLWFEGWDYENLEAESFAADSANPMGGSTGDQVVQWEESGLSSPSAPPSDIFWAEDRPRDNKGRLVPKFGVTKWGNDYWDYGVSYPEWKWRHPASVRVFAEGYGVDLKSLTGKQKDWLEWRYKEDVDSKTALFALIDEFKIKTKKAETFFMAEEEPFRVRGSWGGGVVEFSNGDVFVKVISFPVTDDSEYAGESMWVVLEEGNEFEGIGILDNDPIHSDIKIGSRIKFTGGNTHYKPHFVAVVEAETFDSEFDPYNLIDAAQNPQDYAPEITGGIKPGMIGGDMGGSQAPPVSHPTPPLEATPPEEGNGEGEDNGGDNGEEHQPPQDEDETSPFDAETLGKDSCCCGATKADPCACMIKGVMDCSATCPCSLEKKGAESFNAEEPFICDECGRQATQAKGTNWCINCENEYQSGLHNPDAAFGAESIEFRSPLDDKSDEIL